MRGGMDRPALVYARVSSAEQAKGWSPETQLEACRAYAAQHGMHIVGEYQDAETGTTLERDGFQRMMQAIRAGETAIVIVYQTDRLHRDLAHAMLTRKELQKLDVELHTVRRGKSGNTPEEQFADNIDDLLAELERARIAERTNRGKRAKMKSGQVLGAGPAPYGYIYIGQGRERHLEIDPSAAEIVRLIFRWYAYGDDERGPLSVNAIAERLTTMAVPSPADRAGRERWGKQRPSGTWVRSHVYPILNQTAYSGIYQLYRRRRLDKTHYRARPTAEQFPVESPAIVDPDTWAIVQRRLADGKAQSRGHRTHEYLLSKRIRCACGYRAHGRSTSKNGRHHETRLWYICNGRIRRLTAEPCPINLPWFRAETVDDLVWESIADMLRDPKRLEERLELLQRSRARDTSATRRTSRNDLIAHREKLERANMRVLDLYEAEEIDRQEWRKRKAANDAATAAIDAELAALEQPPIPAPEPMPAPLADRVRALADSVRPRLDVAPFDARQRLLDALNVQVELATKDDKKIANVESILGREVLHIP